MPQPIQPVIDAIKRGDKHKAIELIKQALNVDPNDINMLLALATIMEEPTRKRQVLNRVLSLAPANKPARDMLLQMDRAEMSANRPQPGPTSVSQPTPPRPTHRPAARIDPEPAPAQPVAQVAVQDAPPARPAPASTAPAEKSLVFRPSTVWLALFTIFTSIFCCAGLLIASQNAASSLLSFALALLFGLTAVSLWSKVEVTGAGLRSSTLLGSTQIQWDEIASLKSNSMKRRLELISNKGKSVSISTQVKGYPRLIEILRQKRPDLFGETRLPSMQAHSPAVQGQTPSTTQEGSPAPAGTKTFKKNFFKQYGILFALVPLCLLFVGLGLASVETRIAFLVTAGFCSLLMLIPFFQVSGIKIEPNRLVIQTFFEEKELSARQIKEIKMQSVHGRYGRVTNFVNIIPLEGKNYPLSGFSEGEEIIYGLLMNWWNRYQNR